MRRRFALLIAVAMVLATCGSSAPVAEVALRYGTITERAVDIGADGRNTTAAVTGLNEFAVDLYGSVALEQTGNFVVSRYS
ncbi:MAG: hypothetical protein P8N02_10685, partial [Actinomycetota bacterium]|nr:hypothetical protein [Actinomycetota bacterium]